MYNKHRIFEMKQKYTYICGHNLQEIMKTINWISSIAIIIMTLLSGCKEPQPSNGDGEGIANGFTYNDETIAIGSVVRFDQDNHTVQFWLSPEEGLATIDDMERNGNYLIVSTHMSYIGSRDRFTKPGSFVRYGQMQFAYADEGMGYIETSLSEEEVTISFSVEKMASGSNDSSMAIQGHYKGSYSSYSEEPLENECAVNRVRTDISKAEFTFREDGGPDTYRLFDSSGSNLLEFTLPQSRRGLPTLFNTKDESPEGIMISYYDRDKIDLSQAFGSITADINETSMNISFDISAESERIRAEYDGVYDLEIRKSNRYIYDSGYPYGSGYDGRFNLVELRTEYDFGKIVMKFIPYDTDERFADIPELTITDISLIGQEMVDLRNTPGWYFEFDKMAVSCYENEWKPAASEGSYLTILETENGDGIIVDLILSSEEPTFKYISTIDLHYEGLLIK